MTSMEVRKPFEDADAHEPDGTHVERILFPASMLMLALVVPVWIGMISRDVYAAGAVKTGEGARTAVTVPGETIDAKNVNARKVEPKKIEATKVEATKIEANKIAAKKTGGTVPAYIPPDP